jgi:hypothetical protein
MMDAKDLDEADARLICAAPDMLAALKAVVASAAVGSDGIAAPWSLFQFTSAYRLAEAAIALAEGKQP